MNVQSVPQAGVLSLQQRAFLLHQVELAGGKLAQSDGNKQIPATVKDELQLPPETANATRTILRGEGCFLETKVGRSATYEITEKGREELARVAKFVPLLPAKGPYAAPVDLRQQQLRHAYVLQQLADHPGGPLAKSDAEQLKTPDMLKLNLATARRVRGESALADELLVHRHAAGESYEITPKGRDRLRDLRAAIPVLPPLGKSSVADSDDVRQAQEAFALIQLLRHEGNAATLEEVQATKKLPYPKKLKLNAATAWQLRDALTQKGLLSVTAADGTVKYAITLAGLGRLTELSFDALPEWKIPGLVLTKLLRLGRESGTAPTAHGHSPAGVEQAVLETFERLLRERHFVTGLVPIHEIRADVRLKLGDGAASHAAFDDVIRDMRRSRRGSFVSISDRSQATAEQLRGSVEMVGQLFFYMEKLHASASG